jgi:6-phosphogluconolactonase
MPAKMFGNPLRLLAPSAILAFALLLVSCGSNKTQIVCSPPSGQTATCTCACPVQLTEYLYTSSNSGQILAFNIDTSTGVLSSPISTQSAPASMGIASAQDFLYISDPNHGQVDGFTVGPGGTLSTLAGSPFSIGQASNPQSLVSPSGNPQFLYATDNGSVDAFSISSAGVPTVIAGSPFPSGTNLYLATDSAGQFLYTSIDDAPGGIFGFVIGSNGALTAIPGSPFAIPGQTVANSQPSGIIDNGSYVYAALTGSNQIAAFAITTGTGVLAPVANSPFPAGNAPSSMALAGSYLYAINSGDSTISGYNMDSSSGVLTPLANSPFPIAGNALEADFSDSYLYVSGNSGIQAYTIDSTTGDLTIIAGSPFADSQVTSFALVVQ